MANLFAYGLLKSDGPLAAISRKLGEFRTEIRSADPYYDLFSLGYAPGVMGGSYYLLGELWEMKPQAFEYLDRLEAGYQRREIKYRIPDDINFKLSGNLTVVGKAWLYFYRAPTEGHIIYDPRIVLNEGRNEIFWNNNI